MFFETVERGFALQARVTTLVTGLSGLHLAATANPPRCNARYTLACQDLT